MKSDMRKVQKCYEPDLMWQTLSSGEAYIYRNFVDKFDPDFVYVFSIF
jgi:hypothetical protein